MTLCVYPDCPRKRSHVTTLCSTHNREAKKYGLGVDRYIALRSQTTCDICHQEVARITIDHDHACCQRQGSCGDCVRGALCYRCNTVLGKVHDDPELLLKLIQYLNV